MASRIRHLRARALKALFKLHMVVYEGSDGRLGAHLKLPMLLLTVTGRKSREPAPLPWRTSRRRMRTWWSAPMAGHAAIRSGG